MEMEWPTRRNALLLFTDGHHFEKRNFPAFRCDFYTIARFSLRMNCQCPVRAGPSLSLHKYIFFSFFIYIDQSFLFCVAFGVVVVGERGSLSTFTRSCKQQGSFDPLRQFCCVVFLPAFSRRPSLASRKSTHATARKSRRARVPLRPLFSHRFNRGKKKGEGILFSPSQNV